jgi:hypothetical protein
MRTALVSRDAATAAQVARYLPSNYGVTAADDSTITISGEDRAGRTLDGFVIPRLASGLIFAWEVIGDDDRLNAADLLPMQSVGS